MNVVCCKRCDKMVAEPAVAIHNELNHPKRHAGNLEALAKGRELRAQRIAERKAQAVIMDAAWNGAAR